MAARPSLFSDRHDAVLRARDGAADEEQVALGVDADYPETHLGVALRAHVARHALSFDDPGGIRAGADRAGLPMPGVAVGCRTAAESVPVYHTLKSAALGCAGHLDQLAGSEDVHLHLGAGGRCLAVDGEAPKHLGAVSRPAFLAWPSSAFVVRCAR